MKQVDCARCGHEYGHFPQRRQPRAGLRAGGPGSLVTIIVRLPSRARPTLGTTRSGCSSAPITGSTWWVRRAPRAAGCWAIAGAIGPSARGRSCAVTPMCPGSVLLHPTSAHTSRGRSKRAPAAQPLPPRPGATTKAHRRRPAIWSEAMSASRRLRQPPLRASAWLGRRDGRGARSRAGRRGAGLGPVHIEALAAAEMTGASRRRRMAAERRCPNGQVSAATRCSTTLMPAVRHPATSRRRACRHRSRTSRGRSCRSRRLAIAEQAPGRLLVARLGFASTPIAAAQARRWRGAGWLS